MHAVEGMVLGVFAAAWVYTPLRSSVAAVPLLDEMLVFPLGVAACANLLLCTLMPSNESVQAAFFALTLTTFLGYLFVSLEAQTSTPYAVVFFGGEFFFQIPAGISLGLLAVQTLLAAGAVSHRLWRLAQWQEGVLLLIAVLFCCLRIRQDAPADAAGLLVLVALAGASVASVDPRARVRVALHLAVYAVLVLVSVVLAYVVGVTVWAHLTMGVLLWSLVAYKFVAFRPPRDPAQAAPTAVVVGDAQAAQAGSLVGRRALYVPPPVAPQPSAARIHGDAILFGGRTLSLRAEAPVKKHI
jgi:hypothetical protein